MLLLSDVMKGKYVAFNRIAKDS